MADNSVRTPGSGETIRSIDRSGTKTEVVTLDVGGSTAERFAGATQKETQWALWTENRPPRSGAQVSSGGLTTASTSYSIGDVLGNGWEFTNAARASGGTGVVTGAVLLDEADVVNGVDLYLSSGSITFGTDNAAPSVSDTDARKLGHVIGVAALDVGGSRLCQLGDISIPYICDATSLFVYARTRDAHSFFGAVTDLKLRLFLVPD